LLALIDEVLDISRIEAGSITLQPAPLHLAEFVQEIAASIRPKIERKGLHFELDIATQLPEYIHADAVRLRQVLLNLLANAVKYTEQGRITLRIAQPAPAQLQFAVADTGYGIAEADLEKIFESFRQLASNQQPATGLGLGLSISRRLVHLMGSDIQVTSTPGEGSTFSFALPLEACAETAPPERSYRIVGLQHQGPPILVVDDLADNRDVLVEQLAPLGFEMHTAATAQAALELVAGYRPAAIFVDLMLPDMDGAELIGHLRRQPHLQQTLIIVNSGSAFAEDRERSLAAGGDEFLPKPVRRQQLLEVLGRRLQLEWRYADSIEAADAPAAGPAMLPAAAIPAQAELQQLYDLAMMGHAAALKERALELRRDEQLERFAAELERLAGSLQLNRLSAWLEHYLER
jgi:CheY-like chemotaxis protein